MSKERREFFAMDFCHNVAKVKVLAFFAKYDKI